MKKFIRQNYVVENPQAVFRFIKANPAFGHLLMDAPTYIKACFGADAAAKLNLIAREDEDGQELEIFIDQPEHSLDSEETFAAHEILTEKLRAEAPALAAKFDVSCRLNDAATLPALVD